MKANKQLKIGSVTFGMVLGAAAAVFLAPMRGEQTRKYFRERCNTALGYMTRQASKLRETAEAWAKTGKKLAGYERTPVVKDPEAERQAYEEEKRETLGG